MDNILVADAYQYAGKYVTTANFGDTKVITSSENATTAYYNAIKSCVFEPVLIYVPMEDE